MLGDVPMPCLDSSSNKFHGFDKYEVESAHRAFKRVEEFKKKGPKFMKAVQAYADMEAQEANAAAAKLRSVTKVQKKMDKVYSNNPEKGGY